ncbi:MAG: site-specific DNA-methyltransferase [Acidobacteria bacterium]|nr:site-specific DNA-methyltransferase [Acidobacteriota bacterium]MYJ02838.1 site-specific DNA-methyltransferase [Acidobacteriota bacterium]
MNDSLTPATPEPAPGAADKLDRLRALLREMFQLDRGDLDFGLYRIMNLKSAEVGAFLDNDLLPQVKEKLRLTSDEERARLKHELEESHKAAWKLGLNPDSNPPPEIVKLNRRLDEMQKDADAEADVYNHLASFFGRYYAEGDFISQRRYSSGGRSAYLIPYDGEEVKLHWANADQYYVKTTENYASYVFTVGSGSAARRVRFEIAAADNEKDNIKEVNGRQRRFVLAGGEDAIDVGGADLVIRFEHRPLTEGEKTKWPGNGNTQQGRLNESAVERILRAMEPDWQALLAVAAPTEADEERTLLARHVDRYTAKNSFDYFIHKDLGGFLRRELDLYLNTDVLNLDDLERGDAARLDRALARVRATRHVGHKIIDFLAQLEDFQKRLWLKKKFVLETNWCVTLDRVPEALYPEIAANPAQRNEWIELFAADEITGDLTNGGATWSDPPTVDFLKANPGLVVDTQHFDENFTDRLLAALSDAGPLDEQTDGLLVHGENFQALNLLQARYREQIQCVYIDPPYNSKTTQILYKNSYRHSSWICLMDDRLRLSHALSTLDGSHVVAIDENEQEVLGRLLSTLFPDHTRICVAVVHNKKGIQGAFFSYNHDYAFFCIPPGLRESNGTPVSEEDREFDNLRKWGRESARSTAKNCFYPIVVKDNAIVGFGDVSPDDFHPGAANVARDDSVLVYPVDSRGVERKWRYARGSVEGIQHLLRVKVVGASGEIQIEKGRSEKTIKTVWDDPRYIAGDYGTRWLTNLGLKVEQDLYPKSIHTVMDSISAISDEHATVLDYFAGSGTTGHAVVNLNRERRGQRRYVLVEMGPHFDAVILPRTKKVVHSSDWKDGRPVSRDGVSQVFKYVRLESYEDTMDGLEAVPPSDQQQALLEANTELAEDYRLRYALGAETSGSACLLGKRFTDPFAYGLSVVRDGMRRNAPVDLPETFNYLIGLRIESRRRIDGVLAITGTDAEGRNCLVLWRNLDETDHIALDTWFQHNRQQFAKSLDRVYANGDHTLNAVRQEGEHWTAETIEPVFRAAMFEQAAIQSPANLRGSRE